MKWYERRYYELTNKRHGQAIPFQDLINDHKGSLSYRLKVILFKLRN